MRYMQVELHHTTQLLVAIGDEDDYEVAEDIASSQVRITLEDAGKPVQLVDFETKAVGIMEFESWEETDQRDTYDYTENIERERSR